MGWGVTINLSLTEIGGGIPYVPILCPLLWSYMQGPFSCWDTILLVVRAEVRG